MAEALAAFEAGARVDGHTPDSGQRFRHHHPYVRGRLALLQLGDGLEPARLFPPAPLSQCGTALAAANPS
jgi:hypothetical protein